MTYTARYRAITTQRAYSRRVAAEGLPALLEPYTLLRVVIPAQRRRLVEQARPLSRA